jgi:hypothetical protein
MNNTIAAKTKQMNKIIKVLEKCTISTNDYLSSQEQFFYSDSNQQPFQQFNNLFTNSQIPEGLNRNIKNIYEILGHPKKEIYLESWIIMSLEEALDRYKVICDKGQTNVFDIGYKYAGMGYVDMLSCDLTNHLLFYRVDGGSNDYDRIANFNELIKNGSEPYNKFYFSDWFYKIFES